MGSLKVILIVLSRATFTALLRGSVVDMDGAMVSVVVVNTLAARDSGLPIKSIILPVCKHRVYLVFAASSVVWVMVRMFPLMVLFMGICVVVLYSSIHRFPVFIGSLKVTWIVLSRGTFAALLRGFVLVMVGFVLSLVVVKLVPVSVNGFPAWSVMLPVCRIM